MKYSITCAQCGAYILTYDKESPGALVRLFPEKILERERRAFGERLICPQCASLIGVQRAYGKNSQTVFSLVKRSFYKRHT